jgi:hypothetical protein
MNVLGSNPSITILDDVPAHIKLTPATRKILLDRLADADMEELENRMMAFLLDRGYGPDQDNWDGKDPELDLELTREMDRFFHEYVLKHDLGGVIGPSTMEAMKSFYDEPPGNRNSRRTFYCGKSYKKPKALRGRP